MSARRRVLVTGGAGFVGSHLCDRLVALGNEVVAIDDFTTGSERNLAHLMGSPSFSLVRHDVIDPYDLRGDVLFNLACPASPVRYQIDPVKTLLTNVQGAMHGLELARRYGMRFIQASTSEVYGDPDVHPQPESYRGNVNPIGPRACYDEGKRCAETLCFDYHRQHGVPIGVVRIFNTYGPRMAFDDGRVVSNFLVQALRGEDLTVYGDGSQSRSFCFVEDLVEGLVAMMEHPEVTGPVNLGNPIELSMLELAERVLGMVETRSRVVYRPLPTDDPRQRRPDIGYAARALGWAPRIDVGDGLQRTLEDFRARLRDLEVHG